MAKQPKKLTRKDKIEIARKKREKERAQIADLQKRVEALENPAPAVVEQKPQGRPQRDFIGKKEPQE
ncbi:hypothetical protein RCHARTNEY_48 [Rhodobacter phage RcHartney]|nr:hypothetical protein RCHARTNEY_48 [Rhodobacter phage RcHartney]